MSSTASEKEEEYTETAGVETREHGSSPAQEDRGERSTELPTSSLAQCSSDVIQPRPRQPISEENQPSVGRSEAHSLIAMLPSSSTSSDSCFAHPPQRPPIIRTHRERMEAVSLSPSLKSVARDRQSVKKSQQQSSSETRQERRPPSPQAATFDQESARRFEISLNNAARTLIDMLGNIYRRLLRLMRSPPSTPDTSNYDENNMTAAQTADGYQGGNETENPHERRGGSAQGRPVVGVRETTSFSFSPARLPETSHGASRFTTVNRISPRSLQRSTANEQLIHHQQLLNPRESSEEMRKRQNPVRVFETVDFSRTTQKGPARSYALPTTCAQTTHEQEKSPESKSTNKIQSATSAAEDEASASRSAPEATPTATGFSTPNPSPIPAPYLASAPPVATPAPTRVRTLSLGTTPARVPAPVPDPLDPAQASVPDLLDPAQAPVPDPLDPAQASVPDLLDPAQAPVPDPLDPAQAPVPDPLDPAQAPVPDPLDPAQAPVPDPLDPAQAPVPDPLDPAQAPVSDPLDPAQAPVPDPLDPAQAPVPDPLDPSQAPVPDLLDLAHKPVSDRLDQAQAPAPDPLDQAQAPAPDPLYPAAPVPDILYPAQTSAPTQAPTSDPLDPTSPVPDPLYPAAPVPDILDPAQTSAPTQAPTSDPLDPTSPVPDPLYPAAPVPDILDLAQTSAPTSHPLDPTALVPDLLDPAQAPVSDPLDPAPASESISAATNPELSTATPLPVTPPVHVTPPVSVTPSAPEPASTSSIPQESSEATDCPAIQHILACSSNENLKTLLLRKDTPPSRSERKDSGALPPPLSFTSRRRARFDSSSSSSIESSPWSPLGSRATNPLSPVVAVLNQEAAARVEERLNLLLYGVGVVLNYINPQVLPPAPASLNFTTPQSEIRAQYQAPGSSRGIGTIEGTSRSWIVLEHTRQREATQNSSQPQQRSSTSLDQRDGDFPEHLRSRSLSRNRSERERIREQSSTRRRTRSERKRKVSRCARSSLGDCDVGRKNLRRTVIGGTASTSSDDGESRETNLRAKFPCSRPRKSRGQRSRSVALKCRDAYRRGGSPQPSNSIYRAGPEDRSGNYYTAAHGEGEQRNGTEEREFSSSQVIDPDDRLHPSAPSSPLLSALEILSAVRISSAGERICFPHRESTRVRNMSQAQRELVFCLSTLSQTFRLTGPNSSSSNRASTSTTRLPLQVDEELGAFLDALMRNLMGHPHLDETRAEQPESGTQVRALRRSGASTRQRSLFDISRNHPPPPPPSPPSHFRFPSLVNFDRLRALRLELVLDYIVRAVHAMARTSFAVHPPPRPPRPGCPPNISHEDSSAHRRKSVAKVFKREADGEGEHVPRTSRNETQDDGTSLMQRPLMTNRENAAERFSSSNVSREGIHHLLFPLPHSGSPLFAMFDSRSSARIEDYLEFLLKALNALHKLSTSGLLDLLPTLSPPPPTTPMSVTTRPIPSTRLSLDRETREYHEKDENRDRTDRPHSMIRDAESRDVQAIVSSAHGEKDERLFPSAAAYEGDDEGSPQIADNETVSSPERSSTTEQAPARDETS